MRLRLRAAAQQRRDAHAVGARPLGSRQPREVGSGGQQVPEGEHVLGGCGRRDGAPPHHRDRLPHATLVQRALLPAKGPRVVEEAEVVRVWPIVPREPYQRPLGDRLRVELAQHRADDLVLRPHRAREGALRRGPRRVVGERVGVLERGRPVVLHAVEEADVRRGGGEVQEEGRKPLRVARDEGDALGRRQVVRPLARRIGLQTLAAEVRRRVRRQRLRPVAVVLDRRRVPVVAPHLRVLPEVIIEALRQRVAARVVVAQAPLARVPRHVARLFEDRGDGAVSGLQRAVRAVVAANRAVTLVQPGHQRAARWRAHRPRVGARKFDAVVGERDVRRRNRVRAVDGVRDGIITKAKVVGEYEYCRRE